MPLSADVAAGDTILASQYNNLRGELEKVAKASDQILNNDAALKDDDDLTFSAEANSVYIVDVFLMILGNTAADFKCNLSVPSGATYQAIAVSRGLSGAEATQTETTANIVAGTTTSEEPIYIRWVVEVAGTAGAVTLQWAQQNATVVDTKVVTGSNLMAFRVA